MAGSTNELYKAEIEKLAKESGLPGLFLRRAHLLREEGRYEEAILEVKEGLQNFPGNPAAYYFLIRLFLDLKRPRQAEITLNSASKFFSVNELTAWYRELIEETELEITPRSEVDVISKYSITDDTLEDEPIFEEEMLPQGEELINTEPDEEEVMEEIEEDQEEEAPESFDVEDYPDDLPVPEYSMTDETETDEEPEEVIPEDTFPTEPEEDDSAEIVTAGMAIIHARQGNTEKAIEIFRKLIEKEPEKRENYEKIIELLNNKISNG